MNASFNRRTRPARFGVAAVVVALASVLALRAAAGPGTSTPAGTTLRIASPLDLASLDPALARPLSFATWYATCGTLTAFRDAPAPAGLTTRPEAAAGPPEVSQDERTYVFTVRDGLRFSDGSPLTAANFAQALRRVRDPAMHSYWAGALADVKRIE